MNGYEAAPERFAEAAEGRRSHRRVRRLVATFTGLGVTAAGGAAVTVMGAGTAAATAAPSHAVNLRPARSSHTRVLRAATSSAVATGSTSARVALRVPSSAVGVVTQRVRSSSSADPRAPARWTVGVGTAAPRAESGADL